MNGIERAIQSRKVIITCGTGGVGKTTTSAALALHAAEQGKKAVVVTIDPAKRLKTSLGVEELGDAPVNLTSRVLSGNVNAKPGGEFWAIVPDTRQTFEDFMGTMSPDETFKRQVSENPIFQILSREFSGANEYMALQKLEALQNDPRFDFIVLDTPPSRNMVDFLTAPQMIARLFEERFIRWLVLPTNRILSAGMKKAYDILERLTGAGFISHLMEFATLLSQVQEPFLGKVRSVSKLLSSSKVGFVLVTAPQPEALPEFEHLVQTIDKSGFQLDALIINRSLTHLNRQDISTDSIRGDIQERYDRALELIKALVHEEASVIEQMKSWTDRFQKTHAQMAAFCIPQCVRDIHSLEDLKYVADYLAGHRHI